VSLPCRSWPPLVALTAAIGGCVVLPEARDDDAARQQDVTFYAVRGRQKDIITYEVTSPRTERVLRQQLQRARNEALEPIKERYAVVIGVADYESAGQRLTSLRYAARDAEEFAAFLRSPQGGAFDREKVLLLTNENATTTRIRKALFDFLKAPIREDLVVLYFSGHGAADPERPQNLYLLSYDTDPEAIAGTAFPMDDIQKALGNTVEAERVVVFADACHSGGVILSGGAKGVRVARQNEALARYWARLGETSPGRVFFTSSRANEISQESERWGEGHGVFTWALLEGLKGKADENEDGVVTLGEAIDYTDEIVRRETNSAQHPTVSGDTHDTGLPLGVVK
jgi:uncharacterized caspase-like protein